MDEGGDGTFNFLDIDCEMLQAVGEIEGIEEVRALARKLREMKWAEEYQSTRQRPSAGACSAIVLLCIARQCVVAPRLLNFYSF